MAAKINILLNYAPEEDKELTRGMNKLNQEGKKVKALEKKLQIAQQKLNRLRNEIADLESAEFRILRAEFKYIRDFLKYLKEKNDLRSQKKRLAVEERKQNKRFLQLHRTADRKTRKYLHDWSEKIKKARKTFLADFGKSPKHAKEAFLKALKRANNALPKTKEMNIVRNYGKFFVNWCALQAKRAANKKRAAFLAQMYKDLVAAGRKLKEVPRKISQLKLQQRNAEKLYRKLRNQHIKALEKLNKIMKSLERPGMRWL